MRYRGADGRFISAAAHRRSEAAAAGWETRRANIEREIQAARSIARSLAAMKGWETRRERAELVKATEGRGGSAGAGQVTIEAPIYQRESFDEDEFDDYGDGPEWDHDYDDEWDYS